MRKESNRSGFLYLWLERIVLQCLRDRSVRAGTGSRGRRAITSHVEDLEEDVVK